VPTYVYAITTAEHPLRLDGVRGVGDPAGQIRTLRTDRLGAVVSDAPDGLRAKRRDLLAHQLVLERLLDDGTILPMRFGLVGPDDDQVLDALSRDSGAYAQRLEEIDGCLEYNLKASRDQDGLLREITGTVPEARRLNDLTRDNPGAHRERVALGELLAHEVQARQERDAHDIAARLTPYAQRRAVAQAGDAHFLNVSFLVERGRAAEFSEAVHQVAGERGDGYSLVLNGPLPPYSFV
jgi:Gas vesicle synthesis protein GvpL/GvpF